jgi:tetratricopeptide (TPR) repeat protein
VKTSRASLNDLLWGALLAATTALTYWPAVHGSFLWDDDVHLTANPSIVGPLGLKEVWTSSAAVYYPLTLTGFWLQHLLWGLNPLPYHLVNIALHAASAIMLWRVLDGLNVRGSWWGAALWALHPVQVESVAWITELKNTQSCLFYLLATWFFLKWLGTGTPTGEQRFRWNYALALLGATLAILSKTSTVMLPVVLGLCWWWRDGRWRWRNTLWLTPFFFISAVAGAWTIWEQKHHSGALGAEWVQSWPERLVIAGRIVWFYLGKLLWPHPLIFIYPRWTIDATSLAAYLPSLAVALALLVLWRKRNDRLRPVFFAFVYFVVSLFPVSAFFTAYFFRYSFVADHFQYLAAIGPLTLAMAGIATAFGPHGKQKLFLKPVLCCVLLAGCGILSWRQSKVYADPVTLWTDTLAKNPSAWMAHTNLGAELDDQGRSSEAMAEYEAALQINPNDAGAHNNLATHLAQLGRGSDAIREWEQALRIQPNNAEVHTNLAFTLAQVGRMPEAFEHWERALNIKPGLVEAHYDFGVALAQAGRSDEAIRHYEEALTLRPDFADAHYRMALALKRQGKFEAAITHHRKALELEPQAMLALNALAWMLATCPEASFRNGNEAVELAKQAAQVSGGKHPQILDTLAAAYAESGQFDHAVETTRRALNLLAGQNNQPLADAIEERLKLYQARTAYHEKAP